MSNRAMNIAVHLYFIILLAIMPIYAQGRGGVEVEVKIYFPCDESHIDSTYMENRQTLQLVDSLFRDTTYISTLQKIDITAQSSPDGSVDYNRLLAERRAESIAKYFRRNYPQIDAEIYSFNTIAENWDLFHNHLIEDENLPYREQVLEISNSDRTLDDKEWLLKTLDGGETWLYIEEHILPTQRFGANVLFVPIQYAPMAQQPTFETTLPELNAPQYMILEGEESKLLFALKTNLLLDVVSIINLAVEVPIGDRWSVVGEVIYPWWQSWDNNFTMQIESYHAEAKYWLGDRDVKEQLQGWSVGVYGGWGRYDIQPFSSSGVQGDLFDVGLQIGYAHSIAKKLHLEYTLGLGYLSTRYDKYKVVNDTDEYGDIKVIPYPWLNNTMRSPFPTRCGVSLVWLIKSNRGDKR